jgi:ubiquinone/menaquinone biosynthesis C-methylase UbiE
VGTLDYCLRVMSPISNSSPDDMRSFVPGLTGSEPSNRYVWSRASAIGTYQGLEGWIDAGERVVLTALADEVRGEPILDIGVGAGRTTGLLRLLTTSDRYVGIDWSSEMVAACLERYPGLDIRVGDARDLSAFPPDHFALVLFSYNGIDNLGHHDRPRVLAEVRRVLRPGGVYVYCTFNLHGPSFGQRPWDIPAVAGEHRAKTTARFLERAAANPSRYWRTYMNWWHNRRFTERHDSWGIWTAAAQDFNLVQHFTTLEGERAAIAEAGLSTVMAVTSVGQQTDTDDETHQTPWLHIVARKQP